MIKNKFLEKIFIWLQVTTLGNVFRIALLILDLLIIFIGLCSIFSFNLLYSIIGIILCFICYWNYIKITDYEENVYSYDDIVNKSNQYNLNRTFWLYRNKE